MSRHQPDNGADSPEARAPYLVEMAPRWEETTRRAIVQVKAAYGPRDAANQAEFEYPDFAAVKAVEKPEARDA